MGGIVIFSFLPRMPHLPQRLGLDRVVARKPCAVNPEAFQPPQLGDAGDFPEIGSDQPPYCTDHDLSVMEALANSLSQMCDAGGLVEHHMNQGVIYWGGLSDGKPCGPGIMRWLEGRTFAGTFVDGARTTGRMEWSDGRVYCGQWRAGQPHGLGFCTPPKAKNSDEAGQSRWTGKWVDGKSSEHHSTREGLQSHDELDMATSNVKFRLPTKMSC